jgi:hypothetical protein
MFLILEIALAIGIAGAITLALVAWAVELVKTVVAAGSGWSVALLLALALIWTLLPKHHAEEFDVQPNINLSRLWD